MKTAKNLIHSWHEVIDSDDLNMLDSILAEDAVFSSPVVQTDRVFCPTAVFL